MDIGFPPADRNVVEVGVGALQVTQHPYYLMTPALGSCVGVCLWDEMRRRGGMAHVMLPSASDTAMAGVSTRFADTALQMLVETLLHLGTPARRLVAKVAGGAAMFKGDSGIASIGDRNVAECLRQLELLGIPVVAQDTGGSHARTIELHLDTGILVVRSYAYGIREL